MNDIERLIERWLNAHKANHSEHFERSISFNAKSSILNFVILETIYKACLSTGLKLIFCTLLVDGYK